VIRIAAGVESNVKTVDELAERVTIGPSDALAARRPRASTIERT
jgi:hypothetical protein